MMDLEDAFNLGCICVAAGLLALEDPSLDVQGLPDRALAYCEARGIPAEEAGPLMDRAKARMDDLNVEREREG